MPCEVRLELPDARATEALGQELGRRLRPGEGLALTGELGAGKTCLARGVGIGLGLDDPDAVQSPTYLLVMEHPGPVPMLHVDAYLQDKTRAFLEDGGLDYLLGSPAVVPAVIVVEWADRLRDLLPEKTLWVHLAPRPGATGTVREAIMSESPDGPARFRQFPWVIVLPEIRPGP